MPDRTLTVRFWAAAQEAAGRHTEVYPAGTVAQVVASAAQRHPALVPVLERSSLLLDGVRVADPAAGAGEGQVLEVLPPFAGG